MSEKKDHNKKDVEETSESVLKECFVIMPIADTIGYDTGHFDRVLEYIIKPACDREGYKAFRADEVRASNLIMFDVLKRILRADIAICDLSSRNPNVMYELAVRQCFDLPVILIKDNATVEPFDSSGIRYIEYDKQLRIDLVESAIYKISMSIRETVNKKEEDVFSLLQILGRGKAQVKESNVDPLLVDILERVNNLSNQMNSTIGPQNMPSLIPEITNLSGGFIPLKEVINAVRPITGTTLISVGLDYSTAGIQKFGDKVINKTTGSSGTIVGVGSARGSGVFLVEVDGGPLVAARPEAYYGVISR